MATTTGQRKRSTAKPIIEQAELAEIVETTRDGVTTQQVKYKAPIEVNETTETTDNSETENEMDNFQDNDLSNFQGMDFEIPKDKIDIFFDKIQDSLVNESDSFYIRVLRTPDNFDDNFYHPCRDLTTLGLYGCRLTERYKISELLQKRNNNSGGRFNLIALNSNQQPLQMYVGYTFERGQRIPETAPIIARDVFVNNPARDEVTTVNGSSDIAKILEVMQNQHREFMQALNHRGQSEIEKLLLTKAVDMITNPPQQNNGIDSFLEKLILLPQISAKLGNAMFPEPPKQLPPAEQTTFDKIIALAQTPVAQNLIERVTDIADAVAASKLQMPQQPAAPQFQTEQQLNNTPFVQQYPNGLAEPTKDDMQTIIESLVTELESDKPINGNNETISELMQDYPQQFGMVASLCKSLPFADVLSMLISQSVMMQPFPFAPFLDIDAMKASGTKAYIYTPRGENAIKRLEQVYNFLRDN
jgi:hypothetical protein